MRLALACALAAALPLPAEDSVPRATDDLDRIEAAARLAREGRAAEAVAAFVRMLEDPETADLFVRDSERPTLYRGWRATALDAVAALRRWNAGFREAWESEAQARLAPLEARRDLEGLEALAARFGVTRAAIEALRRLAAEAHDRGDLDRAVAFWERAGTPTAPEAARWAAARRATGRGAGARELARRWDGARAAGLRPRFFAKTYPELDAEMHARGRRTTLRRVLRTLDALPAPAPPAFHGERSGSQPPFAPVRRLMGPPETLVLFTDLPPRPDAGETDPLWFREPWAAPTESALRAVPSAAGLWIGVVAGRVNPGVVEAARGADGAWRLRPKRALSAPGAAAGVATDGRRVFALVADASTKGTETRLAPAAFVQGKDEPATAWEAGRGPEPSPYDTARFCGQPLAAGGRLYATAALFDTSLVTLVFCFDAASGRRLWVTPLGETMRNRLVGRTLPPPSAPVLEDGRLIVATNLGLVAALDAVTGDPRWAATYLSQPGRAPSWCDTPPLVAAGRVLVRPLDADRDLLLDARTGAPLPRAPGRDEPFPGFRYALRSGDSFVLCGSDGALPAEGGATGVVKVLNGRAGRDVTFLLPDPPAGRPAAAGGRLYVPTPRALVALELSSGALDVVQEWKAEDAGDLARLPGWLVVLRGGEVRFWRAEE